jgi:hypothetical protein
MDALENAGFKSMHIYDAVCLFSFYVCSKKEMPLLAKTEITHFHI